jgi:hypothetical protein
LNLPLPLPFFFPLGVSCDGELFSRLESMVHSHMHGVDIHFPIFKKGFPSTYQAGDGRLGCLRTRRRAAQSVANKATNTPANHDTYQVYASGGSGEDYLGTSSYRGSAPLCLPVGHSLTEAHAPGKTLGKRSLNGRPTQRKLDWVRSRVTTLGCATISSR